MRAPRVLKLTSCQSENSEHVGRALSRYLEDQLGIATMFVDDIHWRERERLLDAGEIHAGCEPQVTALQAVSLS